MCFNKEFGAEQLRRSTRQQATPVFIICTIISLLFLFFIASSHPHSHPNTSFTLTPLPESWASLDIWTMTALLSCF